MLPPTGDQYDISGDGYAAVITQNGSLRALTHEGRPLVAGFDEDAMPSGGASQLLVPWPNRIRDGHYTWDDTNHQLAISEPAKHNASHGLVRWAAWSPRSHEPSTITLGHRLLAQTGYPWTLDLEVTYAVGADGLTVTQRATNRATTAAPYASGAHPYLTVGSGPIDTWNFELPAGSVLDTDERSLPTGQRGVAGGEFDFGTTRAIGSTVFDTCYGDLVRGPDGRCRVRLSSNGSDVELWVDEQHQWLMIYSADGAATPRQALAVEPMTAPVDAFNTGTDLIRLEPDAIVAATWGVRVP